MQKDAAAASDDDGDDNEDDDEVLAAVVFQPFRIYDQNCVTQTQEEDMATNIKLPLMRRISWMPNGREHNLPITYKSIYIYTYCRCFYIMNSYKTICSENWAA